ncbi:MAG: type II toxin-antitoxin system HicB family antitoxin [Chloroflexi bacterium]|nr:type II toxin-antitoxin system HicB family antitoxin [Chloroflexota bacterium]
MYRFLIIIEQGEHNYSAYVHDLPGCIATGRTLQEVEQNMREAIVLHVQAMLEDGESIPVLQTTAEYVEISVPGSA